MYKKKQTAVHKFAMQFMTKFIAFTSAFTSFASRAVYATPIASSPTGDDGIVPISQSQLASFSPFTEFARAAYCPAKKLRHWKCGGTACKANPDFQVAKAGGNGNTIQTYFVGFSPSQHSIIVAHQGTDPSKVYAAFTNINIPMGGLNPKLFPGVPSSVQVHQGFRNEQALSAKPILRTVKKLMKTKHTTNVTVVGRSLGGALAELDSLFLTLNLPNATVKAITYGTPRVGNPAFARLIDSKVPGFVRINNQLDPVPIVPGQFLGFAQPHGEIHILSLGHAVSCDDDAVDPQCQIRSVPNIFAGNVSDHNGPYEGISIGTAFCTK